MHITPIIQNEHKNKTNPLLLQRDLLQSFSEHCLLRA